MRVLLFVLIGVPACAADLQVWNTTEATVYTRGAFEAEAYGTLRVRDHVSSAYDNRVGGAVRVAPWRRVWLRGGYLRRWVESEWQNRLIGGPTFLLAERTLRLESALIYERHLVRARDFNRYKVRFDVERPRRRISPAVWDELSFGNEGLVRARALAGIRWRGESGWRLEAGYQFDTNKTAGAWAPRHAIRTTLHLGRL